MKYYNIPGYLLYTLIIAIVLISSIFFFAMRDSNECIGNPLIYGAQKATNDETGSITCSCSFSNPSYSPFYFDENDMSVMNNFIG